MWVQWLWRVVLPGEDVVIVNMDETAIQHETVAPHGNVMQITRSAMREVHGFHQRLCRQRTRAHSTLVAFICNDAALQPHLPQIVLPKDKGKSHVTPEERAALHALTYPFEIWFNTGGWMTGRIMRLVLSRLKAVIAHHRPGARILLIIDAAGQHSDGLFLLHAARERVLLLMVPGCLTWLLQMLDTMVFRLLKQRIRELHVLARARSPTGELPQTAWVTSMAAAAQAVLVDREWARTFASHGFTDDARVLVPRIARYMLQPVETLQALPARPLGEDEFDILIGRHRLHLEARFNNAPRNMLAARAAAAKAKAAAKALAGVFPLPALPPPAGPLPVAVAYPLPGRGRGRGAGRGRGRC
jgi:hypothetical protein